MTPRSSTAIAVTAILMLVGCRSENASVGQAVGEWSLRSLDTGEVRELGNFKGKAIFLNVWATWCPPCVAEMPSIVRLAEKFEGDPNVAFILVSVDKDIDDLQKFVQKQGLKLPIYTSASPMPAELQTQGIPATFIIDPEQRIQKRQVGSYEWDRLSVIDMIKSLTKGSTG
jgi:thiol-disulfide isomerase/thioredoxin